MGRDVSPGGTRLSRRIVEWMLAWGDRPSGAWVLVVLTLLEATFFPAPTEAMLLALCISRPRRAWWFAGLAAVGSAAGGVIAYYLGAAMFAQIGEPLLAWLGFSEYLPDVADGYRDNAWLALVTSAYTPIPYMLYTMAAGAFAVPLGVFVVASVIGRALKYAPIAVAGAIFGPSVRRLLLRYAGWAGMLITAVLVTLVVWRML